MMGGVKAAGYFIALLLSLVCVVLSVGLILVARSNQDLQIKLQRQQDALNSGLLGAQGQQISGSVLQDLGNAAAGNPAIRKLLTKYGYRTQAAPTPAAAALESAGTAAGDSPKADAPTQNLKSEISDPEPAP